LVLTSSDEACLCNITPGFGIGIVYINLQTSPHSDCIVTEVVSVTLSVFSLS